MKFLLTCVNTYTHTSIKSKLRLMSNMLKKQSCLTTIFDLAIFSFSLKSLN